MCVSSRKLLARFPSDAENRWAIADLTRGALKSKPCGQLCDSPSDRPQIEAADAGEKDSKIMSSSFFFVVSFLNGDGNNAKCHEQWPEKCAITIGSSQQTIMNSN